MTRLEKLMLRVEMIDKASGPGNKLAATLDKITERAEAGFTSIVKGGLGLVGTGYALNRFTNDAREMNRALGEVQSLDVAGDAMDKLERRALAFSIQYGESATDFVRSSYDIQSAIAGLVGGELATFTQASNILAKGTKSDAATITNYMGTMYGIFKQSADAMGKSQWVEQLTGQTAAAVQMFKTTGSEMSAAFGSLGAEAHSHKVAIGEQMAVLGQLQATMSGSEAGTKYKAFLAGVGRAQQELGLQFTDSHGRMLPIVDILEKIRGRFGDIDTVAEADLLQKAFGRKEAVATIKLLMNDTNGLVNSMEKLNSITGMDNAAVMAKSMVDPLDRVKASATALRIVFGKLLLNHLIPFYDRVSEGMGTLTRWGQMFPNIANLVAKLTLVIFGFTAAVSALLIVKGVGILAAAAFGTALIALRVTMVPFGPLLGALRMSWLALNMQLAAGAGVLPALKAAWAALRTQLVINTLAVWKLNAAFWANPITWIVAAIIGLVAGLVLLYRNWDKVTAALDDSIVFQALRISAQLLGAALSALGKVAVWGFEVMMWWMDLIGVTTLIKSLGTFVGWLGEKFVSVAKWIGDALAPLFAFKDAMTDTLRSIADGGNVLEVMGNNLGWLFQQWQILRSAIEGNALLNFLFTPLLMSVDAVSLLLKALEKIPQWFAQFKNWLGNLNPFDIVGKHADWLIDKLNLIPGINIGKSASAPEVKAIDTATRMPAMPIEQFLYDERQQAAPPLVAARHVPPGGLMEQINNSSSNRNMHIEKLEVNTTQPVHGNRLADELQMAAG